jgi:dienelactone hydrolase
MPAARKRRWPRIVIALAAIAIAWWLVRPYVRSAALLLDMTGVAPGVRRWIPVGEYAVTTHDVSVTTRHGEMPARVYRADVPDAPTLIVFPGVHGGGLEEPRLVALSRRIAAAGATVLSTPLPDLRQYRLTPRATDMMEDAIAWLAANRDLAPAGRIGVVGVSFAGGLALVAAGRPGVADRITALFALGPHADLPRVVRYLCIADGAPKTLAPPHDYGVVLMLRASARLVVPSAQVPALDRALVTFLDASSEEALNKARAEALFADARAQEAALPEPARGLMHAINTRDVAGLGKKLVSFAEQITGDANLSPARSPLTRAPVFLLHGVDDNVIPSSESTELERLLREGGNTRVRLLLTPLLSHADARTDAGAGDVLRLISFWTAMWGDFASAPGTSSR